MLRATLDPLWKREHILKTKVKRVHRYNQTCTQRIKETLASVISELLGRERRIVEELDA